MNKRKVFITIFSVLLIAILVIGVTYALEIFSDTSSDNSIKIGKISMNYTETSNVIDITNALPMTDEVGKRQSNYFEFSITSNAETNSNDSAGIKIPYSLIVEPRVVDSDKDALGNNEIKVYMTKVVNGVEEEVVDSVLISDLTAVDSNFNLYSGENTHKNGAGAITTKYRLRAWIDYNVDTSTWDSEARKKQYKFAVNVNATAEHGPIVKGVDMLIANVGKGGLVTDSHPSTKQLAATTSYVYTGKDPDNYVNFNGEVWRIIGVFDVDDGTGNLEKRIKLVNKNALTSSWNSDASNDWTKSSLITLLNSGDYFKRTGAYSSNGLSVEAKDLIDNAKWYLGGVANINTSTVATYYSSERNNTVYSGRPTFWTGKVGILYPSDYGYATSGGTTTDRNACLSSLFKDWNSSSISNCKDNDWLYDSSNNQWTLMSSSANSYGVTYINSNGALVINNAGPTYSYSISPVVYLKNDVKIVGGSGLESSPYQLSL